MSHIKRKSAEPLPAPMVRLLQHLGLSSLTDTDTVMSRDIFERYPLVDACELRAQYNYESLPFATAEDRLQLINRILGMHYGMIIDSIKKLDNIDQAGYQLEHLHGYGI